VSLLDLTDVKIGLIKTKTTCKTKANQGVRTSTPFLSLLPLEIMSAISASPLGTRHITESQHGRGTKGLLSFLRTPRQVLDISMDGDYSTLQFLPPSSESTASGGLTNAAFHISQCPSGLFCGGTKIPQSPRD